MKRTISNFGVKAVIEVANKSSGTILDTTGLRVDFNIDLIPGFNTAQFMIYNLSKDTIGAISSAGNSVRLKVAIHDQEFQVLNYTFTVVNAITEILVPNSVTTLHCMGGTKLGFFDKPVKINLKNPTLDRYVQSLVIASGGNVDIKYVDFPQEVLTHKPIRPIGTYTGKVGNALAKLGRQVGFVVAEGEGNIVRLVYMPNEKSLGVSKQGKRNSYQLKSRHMRSNPKVGFAEINIESNLDFDISVGTLLDVSSLLTVSAGDDNTFLATQVGVLKQSVGSYSKYTTLTVNHSGSTHTNKWTTKAMGVNASARKKVKK